VSQGTPCRHFLFKSNRNNRTRKAQTRSRVRAVVALCVRKSQVPTSYPLEGPAEETLPFIRIHLRT